MSEGLAPRVIVAKLIRVLYSNVVRKRKTLIKYPFGAAVVPAVFICSAAMAQVSGMASPTPTIGATSPLGMETDSAVSPTGIPLGSTEIASPGVSPASTGLTGTISMPNSGSTCSTVGAAPSGMYGSTATYDGGGMTLGTPAAGANLSTMAMSGMLETSGLSGMCGSGSSSIASSSAPTSTTPTTPGGVPRTGIPLGSTEIGNLGVSSAAAVPMVSVSPTVPTMGPVPTMPAVSSATASTIGNTPYVVPGSNPSGSTLAPTGPQ
jgi:hypothetical protein